MDKPARQEERMRRDRDAIQKALDKFTDTNLRTLVERGERGVIGTTEGELVGGSKGEASRPTERVALEGLPNDEVTPDVWRELPDPIAVHIRNVAALLDLARDTIEAAEDKLQLVLNLSVKEFELLGQHRTAGICRACLRPVTGSEDDRLRNGYCDKCRQAWKRLQCRWTDEGRAGAPDRVAFEVERRKRADEERRKQAS